MKIDRRGVLNSVLDTIKGISDKEYQKRVWIRGEGPECDDFDETCCNFFGDGDPLLENYKDFGITENQYKLLKKFRDQFRAFSNENNWPQKFIDTSEWDRITEMAKGILKAFNYQNKKQVKTKQNLKHILETIADISNKKDQKKRWVFAEGDESDNLDEMISDFFQEGNEVIQNYKDFDITDEQYQALVRFRDELDAFCNGPGLEYPLPKLFPDAPEWKKVTDLGEEVLKVFNYRKDSE